MKVIRALSVVSVALAFAVPFVHADTKADKEAKEAVAKADKKMDITATLEAKERQILDSFKSKDSAAFLNLIDPNGWYVDPNGIQPASSGVDMMKQVEMKSYTIESYKTYMIDKDAYVATFVWNGDATFNGGPYPSGPWYCSTTWAKRGKDWKAVYHQESLAMSAMSPAAASH